MTLINGYPKSQLDEIIYGTSRLLSPAHMQKKIDLFRNFLVSEFPRDAFLIIPVGENCGPRVKIRELGYIDIGSNYFDNIVVDINSSSRMISSLFRDVLCFRNLVVSSWEGHDSVLDVSYNIYFHHYFHLAGSFEKKRIENGCERRFISDADIPLFYTSVRSQFEYLAEKFIISARIEKLRKIFIVRKVGGEILDNLEFEDLRRSLTSIGCSNFSIVIVHSSGDPSIQLKTYHFLIEETPDMRWGLAQQWDEMFAKVRNNWNCYKF